MGQLGMALDAIDTLGTMNGPVRETPVDFDGTGPAFPHHFRILLRTVAAETDLFGSLSRNFRVLSLQFLREQPGAGICDWQHEKKQDETDYRN